MYPETKIQTVVYGYEKQRTLKKQMERQRVAEDARLIYLLKEQEVIEGLREVVDDSMSQTEGVRKYNREFQEQIWVGE